MGFPLGCAITRSPYSSLLRRSSCHSSAPAEDRPPTNAVPAGCPITSSRVYWYRASAASLTATNRRSRSINVIGMLEASKTDRNGPPSEPSGTVDIARDLSVPGLLAAVGAGYGGRQPLPIVRLDDPFGRQPTTEHA